MIVSVNKNVQLLVQLLKKFEISQIVIAPGGSDVPIIHCFESDSFFKCFSVVDERSLVYFALGLAQRTNKTVACVCTSGTAVSNFLPGLTEAFYQNVPLLAITADKNPLRTSQLETQKINQEDILKTVCKKTVSLLPRIDTKEQFVYSNRLINEALISLNYHGKGPAQINIPIVYGSTEFQNKYDIKARKINMHSYLYLGFQWRAIEKKISIAKKILIVVGQNIIFNQETIKNIEFFFSHYNCVISVDYLSNLKCQGSIFTYPFTETNHFSSQVELIPDFVISIGNNIPSYCVKPFLRKNSDNFQHFSVDSSGRLRDVYDGLTDVFDCSVSDFFKNIIKYTNKKKRNDMVFFKNWQKHVASVNLESIEYSSLLVGKIIAKTIPENSILHTAILNSTRIMQFFNLPEQIFCYSNIGALGIDGCLSTFLGQSVLTSGLAYCLIGDLSFFYDMNALGIDSITSNVRIILLNNNGGSEFQFYVGKKKISSIDKFICAKNNKTAKGWVMSLGFDYYEATTEDQVTDTLQKFAKPSAKPLFLEVFCEMENDAKILRKAFNECNHITEPFSKVKTVTKSVLNEKQVSSVRKIMNKMKTK